jgi:hypothetical protein
VQLTAVVRDATGAALTDRTITWTSSSDAVATVSESGVVAAVAPGVVTITASSEGKSGAQTLTVGEGGQIGPGGGALTAFGGSVRLEVPAGALGAPVSIRVTRVDPLPRDPSLVGVSGYALAPGATTFSSAVSLTLRYTPEQGPSGVPEAEYRVHRVSGATLESAGGGVDENADAVTAPLTQLGTFGVARAPAATPCTEGEYRQFDFWVGEWNVTAVGQPPGSPPTPSDITLEPGGCAVFENFGKGAGRSINVYSPADGQWHQTFLFASGQRLVLTGGPAGEAMVLSRSIQGPPSSFDRWTWTQLSEGRVRQLQEVSSDGGVTVQALFDGTYVPR